MYIPEKRTYADRAEYLKKAVMARRKKLRDMALEYGGGKCILCSYNRSRRAMVFHHLMPQRRTLVFRFEDSLSRGKKCLLNWKNAYYIVEIATHKCTTTLRSFQKEFWLKNEVNSGKPSHAKEILRTGNPEPSLENVPGRCRDYPVREYIPKGLEAPRIETR